MDVTYRLFDHTADMGLEIMGKSERGLFINAAHALVDLITESTSITVREQRPIEIEGDDRAELLVNFLREILYLIEGEQFFISRVSALEIEEGRLRCRVEGEKFDPTRHKVRKEIKAVTYYRAEVKKSREGWKGRVVLDV